MKKSALHLLIAAVVGVSASSAQNNTPWSTAGSIGIGTTTPGRTFDVFGQARATYLWAGQMGPNQDGRLYITDSTGNTKIYLGGYPTESSYFASGNVGIGTTSPVTLLQVAGPITAGAAGGSTSGVDYLYGNYGNGKLFVLGSQYSSAASFLAYAVKAQPGATGYLSSTGITLGRASIEANNGYISFLTGAQQASSDGGVVSITEKMRVDASGNVGVGTSAPDAKLVITGNSDAAAFWSDAQLHITGSTDPRMQLDLGYDTVSNLGVIQAGQAGVAFKNLCLNPSGGNVGIGTTNPTQKLSVNGTIRAKEVVVETSGWSDYVFADDYVLQPLAEVEAQIKQNKHLPGIPSAQHVAESGIGLGEMQAKLLGKIEELTLHMIELEKENQSLKKRVSSLETK